MSRSNTRTERLSHWAAIMPAASVSEVGIRIDPGARQPNRSRLSLAMRAVIVPVSRYADTVIRDAHYTLFGALFSRLNRTDKVSLHIRTPDADKHDVIKTLVLCCAAAFSV